MRRLPAWLALAAALSLCGCVTCAAGHVEPPASLRIIAAPLFGTSPAMDIMGVMAQLQSRYDGPASCTIRVASGNQSPAATPSATALSSTATTPQGPPGAGGCSSSRGAVPAGSRSAPRQQHQRARARVPGTQHLCSARGLSTRGNRATARASDTQPLRRWGAAARDEGSMARPLSAAGGRRTRVCPPAPSPASRACAQVRTCVRLRRCVCMCVRVPSLCAVADFPRSLTVGMQLEAVIQDAVAAPCAAVVADARVLQVRCRAAHPCPRARASCWHSRRTAGIAFLPPRVLLLLCVCVCVCPRCSAPHTAHSTPHTAHRTTSSTQHPHARRPCTPARARRVAHACVWRGRGRVCGPPCAGCSARQLRLPAGARTADSDARHRLRHDLVVRPAVRATGACV
jgi:hypothetical protein